MRQLANHRAATATASAIAGLALLAGCATTAEDSQWRPVPAEQRAIVFSAGQFDVNESVYAAKSSSFEHRFEYGIWRDAGSQSRQVVIDMFRSRRTSNYVFASPADPLNDFIREDFGDKVQEISASGQLTAPIGEVEYARFRTSAASCVALRWHGWKSDEWRGIRGGGRQLGTARMRASLCEFADYPMPATRVQNFADAVAVRERDW